MSEHEGSGEQAASLPASSPRPQVDRESAPEAPEAPGGERPGGAGGLPPGARLERSAAEGESRVALRLGVLLVAPVVVLVLLALADGSGLLHATVVRGAADVLPGSLLALVLLLVAAQLVAALLALEHLASGPGRRTDSADPLIAVWAVRLLVTAAVALAVVAGAVGVGTWTRATWLAALAELVAVAVLVPVVVVSSRRAGPPPDPAADPPYDGPDRPDLPWTPSGDRVLAIGASGGGIRAAAFVLGGHQAVQDVEGDAIADDEEPAVFAVSGGSYMASALALRRSWDEHGQPRPVPTPWRTTYAMGSPELERLRRHTRYLFEPAWRTRDGVVSLLMGAAVHLVIVAAALRFVTWLSTQLALMIGTVDVDRVRRADGTWEASGLSLAPHWPWPVWAVVAGVPLLCAAVVVQQTVTGWRSSSAFNGLRGSDANDRERRRALDRMDVAARLRPTLVGLAAGWLVLTIGLPAACVGVTALTTGNLPTATTSSALRGLGFGTTEMCTAAFVDDVRRAVERTSAEGRISPDTAHAVDAGACGLETSVTRTVDSRGTADPSDDLVLPVDVAAARLLARDHLLALQVAGIGSLLLLVVGLLRRGPTPETGVAAGPMARLKRGLLTWLPLIIVGLVGVYLVLWWTFGFLTRPSPGYTVTAAGVSALACALAFTIDANATSMHGFYRSRLADAFAVGVDDDGRAAELPVEDVYRFSDLGREGAASPRLHVVTTLNSQATNQAPSMRGGFAMVLGPHEVRLSRERGRTVAVPVGDYEDFAGAGRVSVMASVAISGAAISPLMGRYGVQTAPYRLLLALFNLRLGTWVRNPAHTHDRTGERGFRAPVLWMTRKPGLVQVLVEAVGRSSADQRWIYLSDGGHLDNTGLVECVRYAAARRLRGRIVVLDASNDPVDSWSAVGDAIGVVRADLNIDLRRDPVDDEPPWTRRYTNNDLTVVVVKAVRTEPAAPGWPGTDWWARLPPNVQSFQLVSRDFPRASTARQKFGDLEFEAYRALGYAATVSALEAARG